MDNKSLTLILVLAVCFLVAATRMSDGFFNIDETLYFIGAEAFWKTGSFTVQNGFDRFGSENLRIWLLSEGPSGLTPQYPVGLTLAAFPLMDLLGQRTLIFLNVGAGIGTLFVTYAIAQRLFGSQQIACIAVILLALCSFWPEFILAHWPHSLSIFFTCSAVYLFLIAQEDHQPASQILLFSLLSGATVGVGMFFRLEVIILLPAFGAIAILFAGRPVLVLLGGALGLVPLLALMMLFNDIRFGTPNPLSYGANGGATQVSRHLVPAIAMVMVLAGLIFFRARDGFDARTRRIVLIVGLLVLATLTLSPYGSFLAKLVRGTHALLLDSTVISDPRLGMYRQADGTLLFWGFPKKALGQSLPWLGCLALLTGAAYKEHKRSTVIILILFATWTLPFIMRSWHGGMGSNMRYFLPIVPQLSILASALLYKLAQRAQTPSLRLPLSVAMLSFAGAAYWSAALPERSAQLHQFISLALLFTVAATCLVAARMPSHISAKSALVTMSLALGLSAFLGLEDLKGAQELREKRALLSAEAGTISGRVVFYSAPASTAQAFNNVDQLIALPHPLSNQVDISFVTQACEAGYAILVAQWLVPEVLKEGYEFSESIEAPDATQQRFAQLNCSKQQT